MTGEEKKSGICVMSNDGSIIKIGKLEAAHRQLRTAITLWFTDADSVSTHSLAYAACEIVSKKRNPLRPDLLFDSAWIKEEFRKQFNIRLKKHANFFKHGDRDHEATIEFDSELTEPFLLFSACGRALCGEPQSSEESAFLWWIQIHRPSILTEEGQEPVANAVPGNRLEYIRSLSKRDFFEGWNDSKALLARLGVPVIG
jgi:hypothetical protein